MSQGAIVRNFAQHFRVGLTPPPGTFGLPNERTSRDRTKSGTNVPKHSIPMCSEVPPLDTSAFLGALLDGKFVAHTRRC
jgi:hypothetical protein